MVLVVAALVSTSHSWDRMGLMGHDHLNQTATSVPQYCPYHPSMQHLQLLLTTMDYIMDDLGHVFSTNISIFVEVELLNYYIKGL